MIGLREGISLDRRWGLYHDCRGCSKIEKSEDMGKCLPVRATVRICRLRDEKTIAYVVHIYYL